MSAVLTEWMVTRTGHWSWIASGGGNLEDPEREERLGSVGWWESHGLVASNGATLVEPGGWSKPVVVVDMA